MNENCSCCHNCRPCPPKQTHVHEVQGSTRLAELNEDPHNHRFAGMTGEVIEIPGSHIHKFETTTDFYENHFHKICVKTGPAVWIGEGENRRHVHFIDSQTEVADGHCHKFIVATLIENPIGD